MLQNSEVKIICNKINSKHVTECFKKVIATMPVKSSAVKHIQTMCVYIYILLARLFIQFNNIQGTNVKKLLKKKKSTKWNLQR